VCRSLLNERFHGAGEVNPLSPPSDPVQRRLQSPPAKSNFLAVTTHGGGGIFAKVVILACFIEKFASSIERRSPRAAFFKDLRMIMMSLMFRLACPSVKNSLC
jgi:hypothetical protein